MLTRECRPQVFEDVAGQELTKRVLKAVIQNPAEAPKSIILQGPFGCGKCVKGDTRIATPDGYEKIRDFVERHANATISEGFIPAERATVVIGQDVVRPVQRLFYAKNAYVVHLVLANGEDINGTPEHKIRVYDKENGFVWKAIKDIQTDDYVMRNNRAILYGNYELRLPLKEVRSAIKGKGYKSNPQSFERILMSHISQRQEFYDSLFGVLDRVVGYRTIKNDRDTVEWVDALCQSLGLKVQMNESHTQITIWRCTHELVYDQSFDEMPGCHGYAEPRRGFFQPAVRLSTTDFEEGYLNGYSTFLGASDKFNDTGLKEGIKDIFLNYSPIKVVGSWSEYADVYDVSMDSDHDFLAQGVVNHNTTQARILAKGLNCTGSGARPCGKCPNCLKELDSSGFYEEYDSAVIGQVDKIRELRDSFYVNNAGYKVVVLDECMHYSSRVLCRINGKEERVEIGTIVNSRLPVEVLCQNPDGEYQWNNVVDWFKKEKKELKKITLRRMPLRGSDYQKTVELKVTKGHVMFNGSAMVPAGSLHVGDQVCGLFETADKCRLVDESHKRSGYDINDEQSQVILGTLLGDSSLDWGVDGTTRLRFTQSLKQGAYYKEKERVLGELVSSSSLAENGGYGDFIYRGCTHSVKELNRYREGLYKGSLKEPTRAYLDQLNPIGIAVWFMDDGSCGRVDGVHDERKRVQLATHGFSYECNEEIRKYFIERWGIVFNVKRDKRGKGYYLVSPTKMDTLRFIALVSPFVVPSMRYKLNGWGSADECFKYIGSIKKIVKRVEKRVACDWEVVGVEDIENDRKYVYDITVEGNHNFFVNGVKQHNCHLCSKQAQSAFLKVLEEAPKSIFFVFCTTEVDKILPTIRSRSLELELELVPETQVLESLHKICKQFNLSFSDEALNLVVTNAHGHMRNAHMLLDKLTMVGEEDFRKSLRSSSDAVYRYFEAVAQKNNTDCCAAITEILSFPVSEVGTTFTNEVRLLTRAMVGQENRYSGLAKSLGSDCLKLIKLCVSEWVTSSLGSDPTIEVALLCIFNLMLGSKTQTASAPAQVNRFARR